MIVIRSSCSALRLSYRVCVGDSTPEVARRQRLSISGWWFVVGLGCAGCVDGVEAVVFALAPAGPNLIQGGAPQVPSCLALAR